LIFAQFAIGYKDIFISLSSGRQGELSQAAVGWRPASFPSS
jgi:hypothetical protein